ncbi:MAG: TetR/AcrR family transcriptional regulator [Ilumatobacteraceae bacterium]
MSTTLPAGGSADHDPRIARSRAKVLAAATELLVEAGPRGVTADAIAEHSGVAKSTLYRHWNSINELLLDVVRVNLPADTDVDLAVGFDAALRGWVDRVVVALSAPGWARILSALLELRQHSPEMAALLTHDFDDKLSAMASILDLGAAEGRLPAGLDPALVTQTLSGPLVLTALSGDESRVAEVAGYVLGRFLASYPAQP